MDRASILVVEDEGIVARDIKDTLVSLGYEVPAVVASGEAAIEKAGEHMPDAILMDIMLKGRMSGIEAAQAIKEDYDIPIIYLTAYSGDETLEKAKETEPFGYLVKPFEVNELKATIEVALYKAGVQRRLKESEARYRAVVQDQTELICRFQPDGTITFVNDAFCRFFGKKREDILGSNFMDCFPSAERWNVAWHVSSSSTKGRDRVETHEQIVSDATDRERWLRCTTRAIFDESPHSAEFQCVARDVTEQKAAEKALRDSESRFRTLLEDLRNIAVQGYGPDGAIHYWNRANESIYGFSAEEALGKNVLDLVVPPEMREQTRASIIESARTSNVPMTSELLLMNKDGSRVPVLSSYAIVEHPDKDPELFRIDVDLRDLKQTEHALRESQELLQAVQNNVLDAMMVIDRDYNVTWQNRRCIELLGEANGRKCSELMHGLGHSCPECAMAEVFEGHGPQHAEETLDAPESGRELTIWSSTIPMRDESGHVHAALKVMRDITDRKQAEEEAMTASRMKATATLAGGIAHRFNNLMAGVLSNAELIREELGDHHPSAFMLKSIEEAAEEAGNLAHQILAFARGGKYWPKTILLNTVVQNTLTLQQQALPSNVKVDYKYAKDLWEIEADPTQIGLLLVNLFNNAIEAIDVEGGEIVVETGNLIVTEGFAEKKPGLQPGQFVSLSMRDTGCGMSEETRSRVFEPFFTTKFQGRGMGLAATYGIVKAHHGYIFVESEEGKGTGVTIYIPARTREAKPTEQPRSAQAVGTETVLVIDDEEMVLEPVCTALEHYGYRVLTARNGLEGVKQAREFEGEIDVTILDMIMPYMNGVEAYPLLKEARPKMKVILLTGFDVNSSAQALLNEGADMCIAKPILPSQLAKTIRKVLDG